MPPLQRRESNQDPVSTAEDKTVQDTSIRNEGMTPIGGGGDDAFMSALQDRLIGQGGIVSSTDTDLEASINRALENIGASRSATEQGIQSRFNQAIADTTEAGVQAATAQREGSGGFATQLAALRNVTGQTDKRISQLEQQREQALLSNDAQAAQRINDIIIKEQELETQARQNMIQNIFSAAQLQQGQQRFEASQRQEQQQFEAEQELAQREMDFAEAQAVNQIRSEFPEADIPEGASAEEAMAIARPFAQEDKDRRQRLEDIEVEIKRTKALTDRITAEAYAGQGAGSGLDTDEQLRVENAATEFFNGQITRDEVLEMDNPSAILARVDEMAFESFETDLNLATQRGVSGLGPLSIENANLYKQRLVDLYPELNSQVVKNQVDEAAKNNTFQIKVNNQGISNNTQTSSAAFFNSVYD